jgi:hypothetical protein
LTCTDLALECDKSFTRLNALAKHMRLQHNVDASAPGRGGNRKRKRDREEPSHPTISIASDPASFSIFKVEPHTPSEMHLPFEAGGTPAADDYFNSGWSPNPADEGIPSYFGRDQKASLPVSVSSGPSSPFQTQPSCHSPENKQAENSKHPPYPSSPSFPQFSLYPLVPLVQSFPMLQIRSLLLQCSHPHQLCCRLLMNQNICPLTGHSTIDISAGTIRAERQVCRSDESCSDILSPPQMTVQPASGCASEHPSDTASIFVPSGAKPAAAAPDDNTDGDQYG